MAITYDLAAEEIPDIIAHDRSYDLNEFDRYLRELIGRTKVEG